MYQCEKHFYPIHCCPLTHSLLPSLTDIHFTPHTQTHTNSHIHSLTSTHWCSHTQSTHHFTQPPLSPQFLLHTSTHSHTSLTHSLTLTTSVRTLPQVANHCVCTYSGGMKRRLSVALAYIGDPQILFLGKTPLPLLSTILSPPPQMSPLQEWM